MKVSGFTFVKNAIDLGYPVIESIQSILPLCDEFIINEGFSEDGTYELLLSSFKENPKIKIIRSQWNPRINRFNNILAYQANIALFQCTGDWAFYIQPDEVIHENDLEKLSRCMKYYLSREDIEGIILKELSFYGDYFTYIKVYPWKGKGRVRIVKPYKNIFCFGESNIFVVFPKLKRKGRYPKVVDTDVNIFHYNFVLPPEKMIKKKIAHIKWYCGEDISEGKLEHNYYSSIPVQLLDVYKGTHPKVMEERIKNYSLKIDLKSENWSKKLTIKQRLRLIEINMEEKYGIVIPFFRRVPFKIIERFKDY